MSSNLRFILRALVGICVGAWIGVAPSIADDSAWPRRILVTNDNGIDDRPMVELARALSAFAEVTVVAATTDRSGTTNYLPSARSGEFRVERRALGDGIDAYALDGYPADCVLFAMAGPMRDRLPDLVVSGINGGANLGDAWFGSGTIGAARTAAYFGVPALAVSGVEDDDPAAIRATVDWVGRLVRSPAVRALRPPEYLTVSFPPVPPAEITGVEVVSRARGLYSGRAVLDPDGSSGGRERWNLELELSPQDAPPDSDVAAAGRARIAVVPMRVDEDDPMLRARLSKRPDMLPRWSRSSSTESVEP